MDDGAGVAAIIVAAGSSRRFGEAGPPKQFRDLGGIPLLERALRPFLEHPAVDLVIVVLAPDVADQPPPWLNGVPVTIVAGGATRTDSVRHGLSAVPAGVSVVLIHDGARPMVSRSLIDRVLAAVGPAQAAVPAVRLTDTVKEVEGGGLVCRTLDRDRLWSVQTPQGFPRDLLDQVHQIAVETGQFATDDAALFERNGLAVRVVEGDPINMKVTTPNDLDLAELILSRNRNATRS